jgi:hypothetical protein
MDTVYKSKIDAWLGALLVVAMGMCAISSYQVMKMGLSASIATVVPLLLVGIGLPLWLMMGTNYSLGGGRLLIRSGPFKWVVPIESITGITPTSNPLSSPALSLDRLQISYNNGASVMISPKNKEQFIRDLEALRGKSR